MTLRHIAWRPAKRPPTSRCDARKPHPPALRPSPVGFSANPDRVAAVEESLDRRRRAAGSVEFERVTTLCADELALCVAEGLVSWAEIAPRLKARCESV